MKVLLVDDHALFLEGLQNLLAGRGITVVGTAADGLEALAMARAAARFDSHGRAHAALRWVGCYSPGQS
ncbi:MAG: hypothetical protein ACUVX9_08545 [Anaerolineae bacterium]